MIETARLRLRRPQGPDADAIFQRYASDPEVTRYLAWPTHRSLEQTKAFLAFSDEAWRRWPAGPYLIENPAGELLGGTGFAFDDARTAQTGYVLARDAWGQGYATEALAALTALAPTLGVRHLYATVHPDHRASIRVLEKCGYKEADRRQQVILPNLAPVPVEAVVFARVCEP